MGVGEGVGLADGVGEGVADDAGAEDGLAEVLPAATAGAVPLDPQAASAKTAAKESEAALNRPVGRRRNLTEWTLWPRTASDARSG